MNNLEAPFNSKQTKALSLSTLAFGACFSVDAAHREMMHNI
jgi:hypothetical protein